MISKWFHPGGQPLITRDRQIVNCKSSTVCTANIPQLFAEGRGGAIQYAVRWLVESAQQKIGIMTAKYERWLLSITQENTLLGAVKCTVCCTTPPHSQRSRAHDLQTAVPLFRSRTLPAYIIQRVGTPAKAMGIQCLGYVVLRSPCTRSSTRHTNCIRISLWVLVLLECNTLTNYCIFMQQAQATYKSERSCCNSIPCTIILTVKTLYLNKKQ